MDSLLVWLFLILALLVGWLIGYNARFKSTFQDSARRSPQGEKHRLQLLFDSYSDDAMDRLINSLDVSKETFQTHLSIGTHFRKQGEVEKAILIHQNLMAHPEISDSSSEAVIYELAKDYKAAGLFDRAESLLTQLVRSKEYSYKSQLLLLDICEREKDWEGAIAVSDNIDLKRHPELKLRVSQYLCEMAEQKIHCNKRLEALQLYRSALTGNKQCVRAVLGLANMSFEDESYTEAIKYLKSVAEISPEDIPLALPQLLECTIKTNSFAQHQNYLKGLYAETGQVAVMLAIVASMEAEGLNREAFNYLSSQLANLPSIEALSYLFAMNDMTGDIHQELAEQLMGIIARENSNKPKFQCTQCGFSARHVHWNCPSCKSWQTVKPVLEYEKKSPEIKV